MPTKIELESLINTSRAHAVDPVFDGYPIDLVWTSSPVPNYLKPNGLKLSWAVDFTSGTTQASGRFKAGRVRCVSSPNRTGGTAPDYDTNSETVRDKRSGLVWQRVSDGATRQWKEALAYCEQFSLAGGGWRLPTLKELLTIVDPTRREPALNVDVFPVGSSERYWTSSEYLDGEDAAYQVNFADGVTWVSGFVTDEHYVRCVR